jgi:LCP family protein required for cell wall assembly
MARFKLRPFVKQHRGLSIGMAVTFVLLAIFAVPSAYSWARYAGSAPTGLFGLPLFNDSGTTDLGNGEIALENLQQSGQGVTLPEPWSGAERVTILIMGLDYRDWSANEGTGPSRTDSMMLLTIDPVSKTAGMLSIPRDLWAVIPGFTPNKINTAYYFGELYKVPGGGPELAMRTVEQTIGVPIDYYAQIDFTAFIRFIDLIGGVTIDVPEAITVDPIGADTNPKNLKPGRQTLNGIVTLAYARERHAAGGDFARAQRQQQVIFALRERVLEPNVLAGLIANANQLYAELSAGIQTNLPLQDAIQLLVLAAQVQQSDIKQGVISEQYVVYGRSPDDLAILIPIPDKIRELRDSIFTGNQALGPQTPGTPEQRVAAEAASISIQNGSPDGGLGERARNFLAGLGANIIEVRGASVSLSQTVIVDHTGNPYTVGYLVNLLGLSGARIIHEYDPNSSVDIELRLGSDAQTNNAFP